ncbi:adenylate kinase [Aquihabitans sp. G128]|uniref:adenylate kinase n=1 Tax=Aquihabitans sp. G128 TaxID=2849779 RepID=UPI001C244DC8|nr:adenylate kinase [Aquihabitans sp. G128]QXC60325.1 adenylate kinase [Aquihabitans sp. G128]
MTDGIRLVMLGRQGAGKGTQAVRLAQHFVVPHISTGDMLRAAVATGTEFGLKAKSVMDGGGLVSDEIMVGIVDERLNADDTTSRGYILDGFPRTEAQALALEKITADRPLDIVLNLEVPEDVVLERITKRRVCKTCGHIYSVDAPPKNGWLCDIDGGEVVQREDDTVEAVRKRLDLYAAETLPLVAFYGDRGLLREVDGLGTPEAVFARLLEAVSTHQQV